MSEKERIIASLKMELAAERALHIGNNQYLLARIDRIKAMIASSMSELDQFSRLEDQSGGNSVIYHYAKARLENILDRIV